MAPALWLSLHYTRNQYLGREHLQNVIPEFHHNKPFHLAGNMWRSNPFVMVKLSENLTAHTMFFSAGADVVPVLAGVLPV